MATKNRRAVSPIQLMELCIAHTPLSCCSRPSTALAGHPSIHLEAQTEPPPPLSAVGPRSASGRISEFTQAKEHQSVARPTPPDEVRGRIWSSKEKPTVVKRWSSLVTLVQFRRAHVPACTCMHRHVPSHVPIFDGFSLGSCNMFQPCHQTHAPGLAPEPPHTTPNVRLPVSIGPRVQTGLFVLLQTP